MVIVDMYWVFGMWLQFFSDPQPSYQHNCLVWTEPIKPVHVTCLSLAFASFLCTTIHKRSTVIMLTIWCSLTENELESFGVGTEMFLTLFLHYPGLSVLLVETLMKLSSLNGNNRHLYSVFMCHVFHYLYLKSLANPEPVSEVPFLSWRLNTWLVFPCKIQRRCDFLVVLHSSCDCVNQF